MKKFKVGDIVMPNGVIYTNEYCNEGEYFLYSNSETVGFVGAIIKIWEKSNTPYIVVKINNKHFEFFPEELDLICRSKDLIPDPVPVKLMGKLPEIWEIVFMDISFGFRIESHIKKDGLKIKVMKSNFKTRKAAINWWNRLIRRMKK